jgi:hypothetical protein
VSLAERVETAIGRAAESLLARQDGDGAWRARDDADFSNGHALTAHVLRALRAVPQGKNVDEAVARGFDFAETMVGSGTTLTMGTPGLPYPMTAAAGTLWLLATSKRPRRDERIPALVRYLCTAQYDESGGYAPKDVEYGGFGYQPARPKDHTGKRVPELNYPHLSAVMLVVEALALSHHPAAQPALKKARTFVERCQNYADGAGDGGFVFSPAIPILNKAGPQPGSATGFRSYGTMTANGIRLLLHLGYGSTHHRVRAAATWLREHFRADAVPGEFTAERLEAQASVYYYYCWTVAHAFDQLARANVEDRDRTAKWASDLATQLLDRQLPDGTWRNVATARKENVIPVADMVVLPALAICLNYLT